MPTRFPTIERIGCFHVHRGSFSAFRVLHTFRLSCLPSERVSLRQALKFALFILPIDGFLEVSVDFLRYSS
jgi:hypothetical protein